MQNIWKYIEILNPCFLHSPFCKAEGLCQQTAIKPQQLQQLLQPTLSGPIRAKQVNNSSPVIGPVVDKLSHIMSHIGSNIYSDKMPCNWGQSLTIKILWSSLSN